MTNIEIVQKILACYMSGDIPGVLDLMDDNVTWKEPGDKDVPFAGNYSGKRQVQNMFDKEHAMLKVLQLKATGFLENENQVAVIGNDTTKVLSTQKDYTTDWIILFTLANGLVTKVQTYMDTESVADAFKR
jgi:ketosteroid isomerase-like protein